MNGKYVKSDLEQMAEAMIKELCECEDGLITTTARLAAHFGYDDLNVHDLFELHIALFKAAEAHKIELDMSEHRNKEEGLPFNLTFVVRNQKQSV